MAESNPRLDHEQLEPVIVQLRGHRVVLDADLARLRRADKSIESVGQPEHHTVPAGFLFSRDPEGGIDPAVPTGHGNGKRPARQ